MNYQNGIIIINLTVINIINFTVQVLNPIFLTVKNYTKKDFLKRKLRVLNKKVNNFKIIKITS